MKLSIASPMLLGTKALLNALAVSYTEQSPAGETEDIIILDLSIDGPELRLLPRSGLITFYQMYCRHNSTLWPWRFLQAYQIVQDYMIQLDRWKDYCDRLDPITQHSEIVRYLDEHLQETFLDARTHYQRCEAIGLNLAKTEILAQKAAAPKKTIALGGDIRYLPILQTYLQSPEQSLSAYSYYSCYHYQDLFALSPLCKPYLDYLNPFKSHYHYLGCCALDSNQHQYDALLILLEADFAQRSKIEQWSQKLKKPVIYYIFAPQQFQLSACLRSLQELTSQL